MAGTTYVDHYVVWLLPMADDKDACTYGRVLVESGLLLYKENATSLRKKVVTWRRCYAGASVHAEVVGSNPSRTAELEALVRSLRHTDGQRTEQFRGHRAAGAAGLRMWVFSVFL